MKTLLTYAFFIVALTSAAQVNYLPNHSFFKDQILANKLSQPYNLGGFFPANESDYDLIPNIIDSSAQYYDVTQILFKKHLIELKGNDFYLTISPTFNFVIGRDLNDTVTQNLYQNTRGFIVEGDLFKNFSFSTSFYENQGRFTRYQTEYYKALGELYPFPANYQTQNAVIPGSGRTKYFKQEAGYTDGFDYAYAIGNLIYKPIQQLTLSVGNNQQFVGNGHRSILLSDNSYSAPYFLVDWKINKKFQFKYMRKRLMNLLRRPATGSVESYYETKAYTMNYFTYMPNDKLNISLFEGIIWSRGDSLSSTYANPVSYTPIPLVSTAIVNNSNDANSLIGINFGFQFAPKHNVYGQFAIQGFNIDNPGFQLGYRGYNLFRLQDFMIQAEYNYVPVGLYGSKNSRLNYTHFNLPMAHIRGEGVQELVVRSNYEWKRIYADLQIAYYHLKGYDPRNLLPTEFLISESNPETYNVLNSQVEIGYRFNRKLNFSVFGAATIRSSSRTDNINASFFNVGMRTSLNNHYNGF